MKFNLRRKNNNSLKHLYNLFPIISQIILRSKYIIQNNFWHATYLISKLKEKNIIHMQLRQFIEDISIILHGHLDSITWSSRNIKYQDINNIKNQIRIKTSRLRRFVRDKSSSVLSDINRHPWLNLVAMKHLCSYCNMQVSRSLVLYQDLCRFYWLCGDTSTDCHK